MYNDFDQSVESGQPVELFRLIRGNEKFLYCTSEQAVNVASETFIPSQITRDGIKQTENIFKDSTTLTFPRDNEFASSMIAFPSNVVTTLTIFRGHLTDPDFQFVTHYKGRLISTSTTDNTVSFEFESLFTGIKRAGLRATYTLNCRRELYQPGCNVDRNLFKFQTNIVEIISTNIYRVQTLPNSSPYYQGGIFELVGVTERMITSQTADTLTLLQPIFNVKIGQVCNIYAGCPRTKEICDSRFSNLPNFGGFPFIPKRNPFNGSSII